MDTGISADSSFSSSKQHFIVVLACRVGMDGISTELLGAATMAIHALIATTARTMRARVAAVLADGADLCVPRAARRPHAPITPPPHGMT